MSMGNRKEWIGRKQAATHCATGDRMRVDIKRNAIRKTILRRCALAAVISDVVLIDVEASVATTKVSLQFHSIIEIGVGRRLILNRRLDGEPGCSVGIGTDSEYVGSPVSSSCAVGAPDAGLVD